MEDSTPTEIEYPVKCALCESLVESEHELGIEGANGVSCRVCHDNSHVYTFGFHLVVDEHRFTVHVSPVSTSAVSFGEYLVVLTGAEYGSITKREKNIVQRLADWKFPDNHVTIERRQVDTQKFESITPELRRSSAECNRKLATQFPTPAIFSLSQVHVPAESEETARETLSASEGTQAEQGKLTSF